MALAVGQLQRGKKESYSKPKKKGSFKDFTSDLTSTPPQ